jgi:hypothetical protein
MAAVLLLPIDQRIGKAGVLRGRFFDDTFHDSRIF